MRRKNDGFLEHFGSVILLALLCLTFLLPLGCAVSSSTLTGSPAGQSALGSNTVQPQFFGMDVMDDQHFPPINIGSQRLWDSGVCWSLLEPQKGTFQWGMLDAEVATAQNRGVDVLLTLGQTPAWASSNPGAQSSYGAGASAPPANIADWDSYVQAVATRYKGKIAAYELWNEPSSNAYWTGSVQQMVQLSADAYRIVKSIDPDAVVVSPAGDQDWLAQFLQAGGGAYVDAIGYRLSPAPDAPEAAVQLATSVRSIMSANGAGSKPLWNTAISWTPTVSFSSDDEKASFVARSLIVNASIGVARLDWYAWDNHSSVSLNLTDGNYQPTEAAYAYQQVEQWLAGAAMNGCSPDAELTWKCQISCAGKAAWIVWNHDDSVSVSTMGMSTETDLNGNQQDVSGENSISVGDMPVLLQ